MLKIENLHVSIKGKEILKGVNLEIKPGEVHAIMGPNGTGKSTLASVIAGKEIFEVTEGNITYKGNLRRFIQARMRRCRAGNTCPARR